MQIKKITKVNLHKPVEVFCLSVQPNHQLQVKIGKNFYKTFNCNFALLFGCSSFKFASDEEFQKSWSIETCKEFMEEHSTHERDLHSKREFLLGLLKTKGNVGYDMTPEEKDKFSYYWTVASILKERFFETYPRLQHFIEDQAKFAKEHGYVVSSFGVIRRLPQLLHSEFLDGYTKKNLSNISVNSPVQAYEAGFMMLAAADIDRQLKENCYVSRFIGNIHDAFTMYVHKNELDDVAKIIYTCMNKAYPEHRGIPMFADVNVADVEAGQVWGFGKEYKF